MLFEMGPRRPLSSDVVMWWVGVGKKSSPDDHSMVDHGSWLLPIQWTIMARYGNQQIQRSHLSIQYINGVFVLIAISDAIAGKGSWWCRQLPSTQVYCIEPQGFRLLRKTSPKCSGLRE